MVFHKTIEATKSCITQVQHKFVEICGHAVNKIYDDLIKRKK
jgi:hypothetical protein